MGTLVAFEWMSLDGVFDADTMENWFFPYDSRERRLAIKETYQQADALLMGRNTYEMLAPYWSSLADDDKDGLAGVLTHTPKFIVSSGDIVADWGETTILEDAEESVRKLKTEHKNIMVIGSAMLATSLAQAGLIDEYILLVQPHIAGTGRHFFNEAMQAPLKLLKTRTINDELLLLNYSVNK